MISTPSKTLGLLSLPLFGALLWACDSSEDPTSSLSPGPGEPGSSSGGFSQVAGDGDGDIVLGGDGDFNVQGRTCAVDTDCAPLACHPVSLTCENVGNSCSLHSECAEGFFCNTGTGLCLTGTSGSPCETDANCAGGGACTAGTCGCAGFVQEQEISEGKLDIYYVFDHSTSMGADCAYTPGAAPAVASKACRSTFAFSNYLLAPPTVDTRLAFQFMSWPSETSCTGDVYSTPHIEMTQLPLDPAHEMIQAISDDLFDTSGTEIEGALRGIAQYTAANKVEGREMIGVLMTDGDPSECERDIDELSQIIADHYNSTGIRTFIIGMEGATEMRLEQMAQEGGALPHDDFCGSLTPPCHYWNVGDASGDVLSQALTAIVDQSAPLGCEFPLSDIQPASGQTLDTTTINVTFTSPEGADTVIYNVGSEAECPPTDLAWHYDDPTNPTEIQLCAATCSVVGGSEGGAEINISGGCEPTVVIAR